MPASTDPAVVLLLRHGRTALNAAGRLRGLADPPLDEAGREQALVLAEALRDRGIERVLASPRRRAIATAQALADLLGLEVEVDPRFEDRDYGPWTGAPKADVVAEFGSVDAAPDVEPVAAVLGRARPALDALADRASVTAVVTHDAVLRPLLTDLDPDLPEPAEPNGCWNEVRRERGVWRVVAVDRLPKS